MRRKSIALFYGGGGSEHEISLISAKLISSLIDPTKYEVLNILIEAPSVLKLEGEDFFLAHKMGQTKTKKYPIDLAIPYTHGAPCETGELQTLLNFYQIPFIASGAQSMGLSWNKISAKLWAQQAGIPIVPFISLSQPGPSEKKRAHDFYQEHGHLFVKSSGEGSSIGCYPVKEAKDLEQAIDSAFKYSESVLVEKFMKARELECVAVDLEEGLRVFGPGEVIAGNHFYSYEEKYSTSSVSKVKTQVSDLDQKLVQELERYSKLIFETLKVQDFARIDFFLEGHKLYFNELNSLPGLAPISMFPKLLENHYPGGLKKALDFWIEKKIS